MKNRFILITAFCFFVLWVFQYLITVNIPRWDDFHGILLPVNDFVSDLPLKEKFNSLISQNNEHRVAVDRIVLYIISIIKGTADMKFLAMAGLLLVLFLFIILVKASINRRLTYQMLLPLPFILFSAHYWEILLSLMVPFQIFSVLFLAFLSFYLASNKKPIWAFILTSLFAIFSHGNGLLTIPIIAIILLAQENYKKLIIWLIYSSSVIGLYFTNYTKPPWNQNVSPLDDPIASFSYFFEFLGSIGLSLTDTSQAISSSLLSKVIPSIIGFILVAFLIITFIKKYPLQLNLKKIKEQLLTISLDPFDTFILSAILFVLGTGFMMSLSRTGFPMASRYIINSQLLVCLIYLFTVKNNISTKAYKPILVISIAYFALTFFNYWGDSLKMRNEAETDAINFQKNKTWLTQYYDVDHVKNLNPLLKEPLETGLYNFPKNHLSSISLDNVDTLSLELKTTLKGNSLYFELEDQNRKFNSIYSNFYLIAKNRDQEYLIPFEYTRKGITKAITSLTYYHSSIKANVYLPLMKNGEYDVYLIKKEGDNFKASLISNKISNILEGSKHL